MQNQLSIAQQEQAINNAITLINQGKVIAFPTDTVYGLGGNPLNEQTILSVFNLKGRSFKQALPILLPGIEYLEPWIDWNYIKIHQLTDRLFNLLARFWPGALTVVLKKSNQISNLLTANQDTIALRVPNHPTTLKLLKMLNSGIIGTSANKSQEPSAINCQQVKLAFGEQLFVLDGGTCKLSKGSTIVSLLDHNIKILRAGVIEPKELYDYIN